MTLLDVASPAPRLDPAAADELRVVVLTHSHPVLTHGGAEISAGALVSGLQHQPGVKAWLIGCSRKAQTARLAVNYTQPFSAADYVYQGGDGFDYFKFANQDVSFYKDTEELIRELQPHVVHFHHYTNFGVEILSLIRRIDPAIRIVLTLHEYLAICHAHGQMIKTKSSQLCEAETAIACSGCFPEFSPRDFFLRKRYIQQFMSDVDLFISPSRFLVGRYRAWGLPPERLIALDNVPPPRAGIGRRPGQRPPDAADEDTEINSETSSSRRVLQISFFGQMSPLKGILVLLAAAAELVEAEATGIRIDIHGDYSNQPMDFQEAVVNGLKLANNNVRYHGPYRNENVLRLMAEADAVVVPSIWWENAPVVIEEALEAGTPVICSNIGGMAEKVRDGIDGLWFEVGDHRDLARLLLRLQSRKGILQELRSTMRRPITAPDAVREHLNAYREIPRR